MLLSINFYWSTVNDRAEVFCTISIIYVLFIKYLTCHSSSSWSLPTFFTLPIALWSLLTNFINCNKIIIMNFSSNEYGAFVMNRTYRFVLPTFRHWFHLKDMTRILLHLPAALPQKRHQQPRYALTSYIQMMVQTQCHYICLWQYLLLVYELYLSWAYERPLSRVKTHEQTWPF